MGTRVSVREQVVTDFIIWTPRFREERSEKNGKSNTERGIRRQG